MPNPDPDPDPELESTGALPWPHRVEQIKLRRAATIFFSHCSGPGYWKTEVGTSGQEGIVYGGGY